MAALETIDVELETINIDLRVYDEGNKKQFKSYQLKRAPKFDNVSSFKEYLVENYAQEIGVAETSLFEMGYFGKPGNKKYNITNEVHLAEAYSLEKKTWLSLWTCQCTRTAAKRGNQATQQPNKKTKLTSKSFY